MITPNDLRNASLKSGFRHVHVSNTDQPTRPKPYQAKHQPLWHGPRRATAIEAADDYCNYINGTGTTLPATLKSAGHAYVIDEQDKDEEYLAALGVLRDRKAQRDGRQGYVYLITEKFAVGPAYGKIGYSVNPEKRVAELQTGNPRPLVLRAKFAGTEADEKALHLRHQKQNCLQEWFHVTPAILAEFA